MATASFKRASPSTNRVRRAGAPTSRKMAITATGSVVATIEASIKQAMAGTAIRGISAAAMTTVATSTATTASRRIGTVSSAMRRTSIFNAASNTRIGRKMKRKASE